MPYTLFYSPDSANIVVRFALEELDVDYDDRLVPPRKTRRDAVFHALNPTGLLPVLVDHDTEEPIAETAAILLYLTDKHAALGAPVSDLARRGAYLRRLFHLSNTVHAYLRIGFYSDRFVTEPSEAADMAKSVRRQTLDSVAIYEDALEDGRSWLLGDAISVCDFYLAACLRWAQIYATDNPVLSRADIDRFPHVTALLTRLQDRGSVRRAAEKEGLTGTLFLSPSPPNAVDYR